MSIVGNLASLVALVLLRGLLVDIEGGEGVDSVCGGPDSTAIRILHNHIGADVKMRSNRRFR